MSFFCIFSPHLRAENVNNSMFMIKFERKSSKKLFVFKLEKIKKKVIRIWLYKKKKRKNLFFIKDSNFKIYFIFVKFCRI